MKTDIGHLHPPWIQKICQPPIDPHPPWPWILKILQPGGGGGGHYSFVLFCHFLSFFARNFCPIWENRVCTGQKRTKIRKYLIDTLQI